jgi:hypothetical protein
MPSDAKVALAKECRDYGVPIDYDDKPVWPTWDVGALQSTNRRGLRSVNLFQLTGISICLLLLLLFNIQYRYLQLLLQN